MNVAPDQPEICNGCSTCVDLCPVDVYIPNPLKASLLARPGAATQYSTLGMAARFQLSAFSAHKRLNLKGGKTSL